MEKYNVIVVGAGHAGVEAALASANMGLKTLLVTGNLNMVGSMPCNPSIGGPAKGVVVREIDALGGYMGKNADLCQIQRKMLNKSKGPAVWSLRFQIDKLLYCKEMLKHLKTVKNLDLIESYVEDITEENKKVTGVTLEDGRGFLADAVVITTGTYLDSRILRGHKATPSGPDNQRTSKGISQALRRMGFEIQRLKTGTPARIKASTIDFSQTSVEYGDKDDWHFSFDPGYESILKVDVPCYLTYTNLDIHNLIRENLTKSAMYGGVVEGIGPRYCPSIEDKVVKFSDKERHQIFFEPESLEIDQEYIQGFSTSMPEDVQDKMIRLLPGLKDCEVIRYAYAIEYDAINPMELWPTLETKVIENLYTAGQINGTSGYEEAAAQGLIAGMNAALKIKGEKPLILKRDEAYIGVMIDDLITKGTKEPYRLLTSRAEYRLLLRHDNADLRLRKFGYEAGLISQEQYDRLVKKEEDIAKGIEYFESYKLNLRGINQVLDKYSFDNVSESMNISDLLKRPEIDMNIIFEILEVLKLKLDYEFDKDVLNQIEIFYKYDGYIKKAKEQARKMKYYENMEIPKDLDYDSVGNLALEALEKLKKVRPINIGQASRISGVNPADISVLVLYLEKKRRNL